VSTVPPTIRRVGVVGGGQLALMMGDEAHHVGVELVVLVATPDDAAVATADRVIVGSPDDPDALLALHDACDVITFDHELVDLEVLERLESRGVVCRPSPRALRYSVDKGVQREAFTTAGLAVPPNAVIRVEGDLDVLEDWTSVHGAAPVLKAARGGYDGRGVVFPSDDHDARLRAREMLAHGDVVVEERVNLLGEVAQLVVRSLDGRVAAYPLVTTVQSAGMCVEVRFPTHLDDDVEARARDLAVEIAHLVDLVGVMAVEYFVTPGGLLVNELALRPHNSGHWTIEGARTSQFANHLRAVSGQELGPTDPTCRAAVMVNVVGASSPGSLESARRVDDVFVHDYGKSWRPGRKLGHVTALGDDESLAHVRAWESARAYGTSTQEA
jgi:phosphoribosylaminoimidazole carboxylase PurK protein